MSKDYYKILGVDKQASESEIKKAFRKKAHQYHPDKPDGDDSKFKEVNEAYDTLSNPQKKKQYDTFGSSESASSGGFGSGSGGFEGFDFSGASSGGNFGGFDFSDLFGGGFGGGQRVKKGRDIDVEIKVSFKESVFGVKKTFSIKKNSDCSFCEGFGSDKNSSLKTCSTCNGHGVVNQVRQTMMGTIQTQAECSDCFGSGKIPEKKCGVCHGSGIENKEEEINVKIPAGVESGNRLKVSGSGEAVKGGSSGDLYIHVYVEKDTNFRKEGHDIFSDLEVDIYDVVLGGVRKVKTVDGEIKVKVPSGSQNGKILKVKNKGVVISDKKRGDLFLKLNVKIPKKISGHEKKLFEELRELK